MSSVRIDGFYIQIPSIWPDSLVERIPDDIRVRFDEILEEAVERDDYEAWLTLAAIAVLGADLRGSWLEAELFVRASEQVTFVA